MYTEYPIVKGRMERKMLQQYRAEEIKILGYPSVLKCSLSLNRVITIKTLIATRSFTLDTIIRKLYFISFNIFVSFYFN